MKKKLFLTVFILASIQAMASRSFPLQAPGEGQLLQPLQADEGPDGNLYVFDQADAFFKVYSPNGKYLHRFGGKGEGPGQVMRSSVRFSFTRDGKSLLWTEFSDGHFWLTVYCLADHKIRTIPVKMNRKGRYILSGVADAGERSYVLEYIKSIVPCQQADLFYYGEEIGLMHINEQGIVLAEMAKIRNEYGVSLGNDGGDVSLPFVPEFCWALSKDKRILLGDGLAPRLAVLDLSGKRITAISLAVPGPRPVSGNMLDAWRKMRRRQFTDRTNKLAWFDRFGKVIDSYKKSIYPRVPCFDDLRITPEGNLLLKDYNWREDRQNVYRLLSAQGRELAVCHTPRAILAVSKHFILYKEIDENDDETLVALPRQDSEAADLLGLKLVD
jgi:hypothetical protein